MNNETQSKSLPKPVESAQASCIARRRLLRAGMAATPVVLALSGRSAMAATGCTGLSPLAWTSLTVTGSCQLNSHTVTVHALGKDPVYWQGHTSANTGPGVLNFNTVFGSGPNTSIYRIFNHIDGTKDTTSTVALFCAALCNFKDTSVAPDYAVTDVELIRLYKYQNLLKNEPGNLDDTKIRNFLKQTWGG